MSQVSAQTTADLKVEADRLFQQGIEQYQANQYKQALQSWQQALIIYQQICKQLQVAKTLNQLGIAYFSFGKYQNAKKFHEQSLVIAKKIESREEEAKSLNGLGNALCFLKKYQKAIEIHEQSLVIARQIGFKEEEVKSLNGLGNAYSELQKKQKAMEFYEQSLFIARKIGYKQGEGKALTNLANIYQFIAQYEKAIAFFEQSLAIVRILKDSRTEATALSNLAHVYTLVGQYQKSIESSDQALAVYRNLGNREGEMSRFIGLGIAYRNLEQYEKAIEFNFKSLAIAKELKDRSSEAISYGNLGVANEFLGQYQKAIEFHNQALSLYRQLRFKEGIGLTLGNLGLAYSSLGEYQKAIELYQYSLVIARELGDNFREGNALNNLGKAHIKLEEYVNAVTTLHEAIDIYETIRLSGLSDINKISIFDTYSRSYRLLQQAFILQNQSNKALEIAEKGRARALIELLAQRQQLSIASAAPNIGQICQIAKQQNATLVEYSIVEDDLYIWVVKPTGEVTFRQTDLKPLWLQQNSSLEKLVTLVRTASIGIARDAHWVSIVNHPPENNDYLQQLYEILIQPIKDILPTDPKDHVIFIPQGFLFLVPFPALQDSFGKYLIERHTILTAPSIEVLGLTQKQREKVKEAALQEVVVVGNPSMPCVPPEFAGTSFQLKPLLGAQREAQAIASLFDTQAIIGLVATKAFIVEQMSKARIIHLATHGLLDDVRGLGSAIAFASCGEDDGWLTAEEILKLELHAELVVLSACDTGRGRITGDGVVGLSRSFISAGVSSILVSLWSVPDDSTALLMTEFYRNFQDSKKDKAAALRSAMLSTMKQYPNNPRAWAAFTLIGEAE